MKRGRDHSRSFGFSETRLKRIFSILAISGETEYLKYRNPNFQEGGMFHEKNYHDQDPGMPVLRKSEGKYRPNRLLPEQK